MKAFFGTDSIRNKERIEKDINLFKKQINNCIVIVNVCFLQQIMWLNMALSTFKLKTRAACKQIFGAASKSFVTDQNCNNSLINSEVI